MPLEAAMINHSINNFRSLHFQEIYNNFLNYQKHQSRLAFDTLDLTLY